ncbi:hypothetical protein ROA7023_03565 [Roseisalinus antarcticus]|uniref:Uncharacterized protein n=1 Tax=Roseisalinus antarcticus TaxID=254357 RepID=A0A1Y5TWV0_9RHOB|nr:hypothetical protein ROA7023_03565 [Roseisalinus antarcticus]
MGWQGLGHRFRSLSRASIRISSSAVSCSKSPVTGDQPSASSSWGQSAARCAATFLGSTSTRRSRAVGATRDGILRCSARSKMQSRVSTDGVAAAIHASNAALYSTSLWRSLSISRAIKRTIFGKTSARRDARTRPAKLIKFTAMASLVEESICTVSSRARIHPSRNANCSAASRQSCTSSRSSAIEPFLPIKGAATPKAWRPLPSSTKPRNPEIRNRLKSSGSEVCSSTKSSLLGLRIIPFSVDYQSIHQTQVEILEMTHQ